MEGSDLVKDVTCAAAYDFESSLADAVTDASFGVAPQHRASRPLKVAAYDFGIKTNILRRLAAHGCTVRVFPASAPASELLAWEPDGVFLSNGPGDPAAVGYAIDNVRALVASNTPMFGICLGHQLMGLALGAKTFKLKFGHRGANHPVKDLQSGVIEITSQNHGFAVDPDSLPPSTKVTHLNLYDGTIEGLRHADKPIFSVQYHPEASPGAARCGLSVPPVCRRNGKAVTMPKRTDIHRVLVIGSGPIVIGQACEFDYSGTQAVKALRSEGLEVVLVNSNPATIMTDPELADRTYVEPLTPDALEKIIARERPDAILPTVGGQTALNLAVQLDELGILKKYDVELIGAQIPAIKVAEDRLLFKNAMKEIGVEVPRSGVAKTLEEALAFGRGYGLPVHHPPLVHDGRRRRRHRLQPRGVQGDLPAAASA